MTPPPPTDELATAREVTLDVESRGRSWQLHHVVLWVLIAKILFIWIWFHAFSNLGWATELNSKIHGFRVFFRQVQAGGIPYVDVECRYPVLTGSFYWLIAKLGANFELGSRALVLLHTLVLELANLANAALFFLLARRVNAASALRATLAVSLCLTALTFGSLRFEVLLLTCVLVGYRFHLKERPALAALAFSIGAGFSSFGVLPVVALLAAYTARREAKLWLQTAAILIAVQAALNVPFVWASLQAHANVDIWLAAYSPFNSIGSRTSPYSLFKAWLGWTWPLAVAPCLLWAALAYVGVRRPSEPLVFKLCALALTAALLDRESPGRWHLVLYPFLMLVALRCSKPRMDWLLGIALVIELSSVISYPFTYAGVTDELRRFAVNSAAEKGRIWTLAWSLAIGLKLVFLLLLRSELRMLPRDEDAQPARLSWPRFDREQWSGLLHAPSTAKVIALLFIAIQTAAMSAITVGMGRYSDEDFHVRQIQSLCEGNPQLRHDLTMLPGYHVIGAVLAKLGGGCTQELLRQLNLGWGVAATVFGFLILSSLGSRQVATRTLGFHFMPLTFPYYFMVYTDIAALALTLLAFYLALNRRWWTAGLIGGVSIAIRQTNAIILVVILLVALVETRRSERWLEWILAYLRKVWTAVFALIAFGVFVYMNGGIALGDRDRHEVGIHIGNLSFSLMLVGIVAFPLTLSLIRRDFQRLSTPSFILGLLVLYLMHLALFRVEHPYNINVHVTFLRNVVVQWGGKSVLTKTIVFIPVAFGFAGVWLSAVSRRSLWSVLAVCALSLLPEALVEQRYSIVPISLWMLSRRDGTPAAEALTAAINLAIATLFIYFIQSNVYAL